MAETITITDNRSGDTVEIPIHEEGVSADDFRKLRNSAAHPDEPFLVGVGGTAGLLTHAHHLVARLYPLGRAL